MQANDATYQGTAEAARDETYADIDLAKEKIAKRNNNADVSVGDLDEKAVVPAGHASDYPTDEQKATLRRVPGGFNFVIFTVAFIEFAERFSYYGCTVVFTNFIQFPLPPGSTTGAIKGLANVNTPGALGKGQQPAFAITTLNTFWVYTTPLLGAYFADAHWGRYKTICIAVGIAIVGHILLIVCAIPSVISNINTAFGLLVFAIVVMGLGTGAFKSNISPLIAEQIPQRELRVVQRKNGELVIEDPAMTTARVMAYFYLLINCGALSGQIGMVFAEQDIGFWLSFTIPTIVFCVTPLVLLWGNKRYNKVPPTGSVLAQVLRLLRLALSHVWTVNPAALIRRIRDPAFFDRVKPSNVQATQGEKPKWMTFDDLWVDEVKRGLRACNVFILFPIYWVCYNQITSNLTSQAATMERNGVPNDLINNLNPISLVIMIPLFDQVIYPTLRRRNINLTPIKKMTFGFFLASIAMMSATITQHYIYKTSPCGNQAATCDETSPLNVWIQTPTYVLIGISEIFASITGLEYAFNKAPRNMRSLVTSVWLIMQAFSAALGQALGVLSQDPLLVANYGVFAGLSFVTGILFWFLFRKLDKEENALNDMRRKEDYHEAREKADREGSMPEYGQAPTPASVSVEKRNV